MDSVSLPMFVLGRRVVEVFGSTDKGGKEDSVTSACHSYLKREKMRMGRGCQLTNTKKQSE